MTPLYQNRVEAGKELAKKLRHHANEPNCIVLALPRGGVPVAYEVAEALNVPLDIFVVRKLGVPGHEELAMGALASGGVRILKRHIIEQMAIPANAVEAVTMEQQAELERNEKRFRKGRERASLENARVILVDDGMATGSTMLAAVQALREESPESITVAVPLGAVDTCEELKRQADEVICAKTPEPFFSVGTWYSDFMQVPDEEVTRMLDHLAHTRRARQVKEERARTHAPIG